ncbi:MAG: hypothetical protein IKA45_04975 [Bacteroidales bacterium]|nr:hypothetical protein [Bacteroidales bacterium]
MTSERITLFLRGKKTAFRMIWNPDKSKVQIVLTQTPIYKFRMIPKVVDTYMIFTMVHYPQETYT